MNHVRCSANPVVRPTRSISFVALCIASLPCAAAAQGQANQPSPTEVSALKRGVEQMEYRFQAVGQDGWSAPNRAQGLRTRVRATGIDISPRTTRADARDETWTLKLSTTTFGRDDCMVDLSQGEASCTSERLAIDHGPVTEWFVNDERGLEQGWTVWSRPDGSAAEICIGLDVKGDLSLRTSEAGLGGVFVDARGKTKLRYHSLAANDAGGRSLKVRLVPSPMGPQVRVLDVGAVYPITIDPIIGAAAWTSESDQPQAAFGLSVSTAGDVNHDGFSDVIVGAPLFDNGEANEGRAFVYLGSPGGLLSTPVWTAESNQANAQFGASVAAAGDVNGDGFDDVIVGALFYDNGEQDEGGAFVYMGSASGVSAIPAWTAESNQPGSVFGASVATAGDINGDGFSDVLVGAYWFDNGETDEGRAFLYVGSATGLSSTPAWTAEGDQGHAYFGYALSSAFDANGDGYDDVLVGAYGYDNGELDEGRTVLYLGSVGGLATTPAWTAEGNQADASFGISVAPAGDVNGDGYADALVGASRFTNGESHEGRAFLFDGTSVGLAPTTAWTAESNQVDASFGEFLATAGDVNGDGFADVIIGAPSYDVLSNGDEGAAYVYLGSPSGLPATPNWSSTGQPSAFYGGAVATAGDVNGDGFGDVLVGSYWSSNGQSQEGRAFVYCGAGDVPDGQAGWTVTSPLFNTGFGSCVASAGDVNGDGFDDVIVGAEYYGMFLYLGSASGLSSVSAWSVSGYQSRGAGAGDVNGDGFGDVVIRDVFNNRVLLYVGSPSGLSLTPTWTLEGPLGSFMGWSVASAGDVNGDGFADVVIGAPGFDNGQVDEGQILLYLGSTSGLSQTPAWSVESDQAGAVLGASVASAGDVNGDGFADVVIGAPGFANGQIEEGRAFLYLGSPNGLNPNPAWTAESDLAQAYFGWSVGAAGDVNGDGYGDVVVGAPYFHPVPGGGGGRTTLYLGTPSGLSSNPAWTVHGDPNVFGLGWSVASAGDVDGDGFSDVIVGACSDDSIALGHAYTYLGAASGLSSIPVWSIDFPTSTEFGGLSIAPAGDTDGDGFSDFLVGVPPSYIQSAVAGRAHCFLGQGHAGAAWSPTQRRITGGSRISLYATTDPATSFRLGLHASTGTGTAGTAAGRARVRMQWEVKDHSSLLNGTGVQTSATDLDTGVVGSPVTTLDQVVSGLAPGNRYRWRARVSTDNLFFPHTRWLSVPGNNVTEMKLRTVCDSTLPGPDCDSNGIVDACDLTSTLGSDCNHDGIPDACQLAGNDCDGNLVPDDCQIYGQDCNGNSVLDVCDVAGGAPDSNNDSIPDSCQVASVAIFCSGDGTGTACPCGNAGTAGNGCASSLVASGANLSYSGVPSLTHDNLVLVGTAMPNGPALYFQGTNQLNLGAGTAFGDGLRCAGGSIIRLGTLFNSGGTSHYPRPVDPAVSVRGAITLAGFQRQYQIWYRDSASFCTPSTFNLTNALSVTWQP